MARAKLTAPASPDKYPLIPHEPGCRPKHRYSIIFALEQQTKFKGVRYD